MSAAARPGGDEPNSKSGIILRPGPPRANSSLCRPSTAASRSNHTCTRLEPPAGAVRRESRPQPTQRHIVFYGAGS